MKRDHLEHIIRAAAVIADVDELMIVGSQSILGAYPNAPTALLVSQEVDLYPFHHPERADIIEGAIGELSMFHETFGYYAQAVGPETCILAPNWESRLIAVKNEGTRGATGWCLAPVDLAVAKLSAQRAKDFHFVQIMLEHQLISIDSLLNLLDLTPVQEAKKQIALAFLKQLHTPSSN